MITLELTPDEAAVIRVALSDYIDELVHEEVDEGDEPTGRFYCENCVQVAHNSECGVGAMERVVDKINALLPRY